MKKNDFLDAVVNAVLERCSKWRVVHENRRQHYIVVGRQVSGCEFVYLDFSARTDNNIVGHGVGWAPDETAFLAGLSRKETVPFRPRDGSLARLQKLENPRDFQYEELRTSTSALFKPFGGYDLSEGPDSIREAMLDEVEKYALPYLCMMLKARHAMDVKPSDLAHGDMSGCATTKSA